MNSDFLNKVGFSFYKVSDFESKNIILRDGRDAKLWVHEPTGHGILDEQYWENIEEDYYKDTYRDEFNANANHDNITPGEHFETYKDLNLKQFNQFSEHINSETKYLEIGCSFGGVLKNVLNEKIKSCSVVEPNDTDVNFLRENFKNVTVFNNLFEHINADDKYNLIVSFEVLEHIVSPDTFIKKCYEVMEDGGIINMEVPNHRDILLFYNSPEYKSFYYHKAHIHYFTNKSLKQLFEMNGCKGDVSSFLMYPFFNHVFWSQNNKPQGNADIALNTPTPIASDTEVGNDINNFYKTTEIEYEKIINEHMLGDCLVFKGTKNG